MIDFDKFLCDLIKSRDLKECQTICGGNWILMQGIRWALKQQGVFYSDGELHKVVPVSGATSSIWRDANIIKPDNGKEIIVSSGDRLYYGKGYGDGIYYVRAEIGIPGDSVCSNVTYTCFKDDDKWIYLYELKNVTL